MELKVGTITFTAPDTLTPEQFIAWIDQLLLRLDKISVLAVQVQTGQASTPAAAAASTSATSSTTCDVSAAGGSSKTDGAAPIGLAFPTTTGGGVTGGRSPTWCCEPPIYKAGWEIPTDIIDFDARA